MNDKLKLNERQAEAIFNICMLKGVFEKIEERVGAFGLVSECIDYLESHGYGITDPSGDVLSEPRSTKIPNSDG